MSEETQIFRRESSDLRLKQIAISSILSVGAAIVGGTTVWSFLGTQFAPHRLTDYRIEEMRIHIHQLEDDVADLEAENQELRIWFEQLKAGK